MQVNIQKDDYKLQLLYVLWVLENYSDETHHLKQSDIVDILNNKGYVTDARSVSRDLKKLFRFGYKVHGVEPELDEDGNELPMKRGAIWLERTFKDEQLSLLLTSVAYNVFINKANKKELLENLISLGSVSFQNNHNASTMLNGGRIYQVEDASILRQLNAIEKAIDEEKKIRFKYGKLKRDVNKFVYETDREHVVSPYWIVMQKGNVYLVGYRHDVNSEIWHYRVDKIRDIEIIKSSALPKNDTDLKGVDVGEYVMRHPNMFTGQPLTIQLKVNKNYLSHVYETFGNIYPLAEDEDTITVKLDCAESDMFYWAVQFGGVVEVLSPQSLREKIRTHIEGMVFKYQAGDGDKYTHAIRLAKRNGILNLSGIDLSNKTKHQEVKGVTNLYLSNNKIKDVNFLSNMASIRRLTLEFNHVSDLSPIKDLTALKNLTLSHLPIKNLDDLIDCNINSICLDLDRTVDLSALSKMPKLKHIEFSESCSYNLTIPWDELEQKNLDLFISDRESDLPDKNIRRYVKSYYPHNFVREAFGLGTRINAPEEDVIKAVDKIIDRFKGKEKEYLELYFKERVEDPSKLRKRLEVSHREFYDIQKSVNKKISHPSYNKPLDKLLKEEEQNVNYSINDTKKILNIT